MHAQQIINLEFIEMQYISNKIKIAASVYTLDNACLKYFVEIMH